MTRRTVVAAMLVALIVAAPAAVAAGGQDVRDLAVHKSVAARADLTGAVRDAQLMTRLVVDGTGTATVADPTSTDGLRDLDRLRGPTVADGVARWEFDVDGLTERRSIARFRADDLPVAVSVRYELDGRRIAPQDLDGASGEVTVTVLVRNLTEEPRLISYHTPDGPQEETVDVAVPFVAALTAELGAGWGDVTIDRGSTAATPRGTAVLATMALFEPLGAVSQELTITARLDRASLPRFTLDAVPVTRRGSDALEAGHGLLEAGQSDAAFLGFGLEESRDALFEVADGVGELLDGLTEFGDGLRELAGGLDEAADGAGQLAGGADEAADGASQLADGTGEIAAGAGELARALAGLADGTAALADGAGELAGGLDQLHDGTGALADGTDQLAKGLAELAGVMAQVVDGMEELADGLDELGQFVGQLQLLLQGVSAILEAAADTIELLAAGHPLEAQFLELVAQIRELKDGGVDPTIAGLALIETPDADFVGDFRKLEAGVVEVAKGARELADGMAQIDDGLGAAADGAGELAGGADELADGTGQIADGGAELAGGLDQLADGTGELAGGLAQLAGGIGELAGGLVEAAGGASELANAMTEVVDGVGELEGGVETLADEVIDLLRRAADDTTGGLARDLARIEELDRRAADAVPFGAPDGARASAAFRIELAAADPFTLPPAGRLVAGLVVLGLAVGLGRNVARRLGDPT